MQSNQRIRLKITQNQLARLRGAGVTEIPVRVKLDRRRRGYAPPQEVLATLMLKDIDENGEITMETGPRNDAEIQYEKLLNDTFERIGHYNATSREELDELCAELFGDRFLGVFARNENYTITITQPYAILNTGTVQDGGEHWIALAMGPSGRLFCYDSFGREVRKVMDDGSMKVISTEKGAEQHIEEDTCGQRCIAWLRVFDTFGSKYAARI